jgi:hypothetical protein
VLDVYLYIVFSPLVRGFPAYLHTCTCTISVAFGPYGIQLVYSKHGIRAGRVPTPTAPTVLPLLVTIVGLLFSRHRRAPFSPRSLHWYWYRLATADASSSGRCPAASLVPARSVASVPPGSAAAPPSAPWDRSRPIGRLALVSPGSAPRDRSRPDRPPSCLGIGPARFRLQLPRPPRSLSRAVAAVPCRGLSMLSLLAHPLSSVR